MQFTSINYTILTLRHQMSKEVVQLTDQPNIHKVEIGEDRIPDEMIQCFNELIYQHVNEHGIAIFEQGDAIRLAIEAGLDYNDIIQKNWLDVKKHYEAIGYDVKHIKPGGDETFRAFFIINIKYGDTRR